MSLTQQKNQQQRSNYQFNFVSKKMSVFSENKSLLCVLIAEKYRFLFSFNQSHFFCESSVVFNSVSKKSNQIRKKDRIRIRHSEYMSTIFYINFSFTIICNVSVKRPHNLCVYLSTFYLSIYLSIYLRLVSLPQPHLLPPPPP